MQLGFLTEKIISIPKLIICISTSLYADGLKHHPQLGKLNQENLGSVLGKTSAAPEKLINITRARAGSWQSWQVNCWVSQRQLAQMGAHPAPCAAAVGAGQWHSDKTGLNRALI